MFRSSAKALSGRYLSLVEREEIALLKVQGHSMQEIGRRLGRAASTVSRELRRNAATRGGGWEYRATTAQWHAERSARRPDGRTNFDVVKQHLALFYTSGSEWTGRMKRLAERAPDLDIFGQKLIAREPGEWRITDAGRALLLAVEQPPPAASGELTLDELIEHPPVSELPPPAAAMSFRRSQASPRGIRRWTARTRRSA
jgi:transposase